MGITGVEWIRVKRDTDAGGGLRLRAELEATPCGPASVRSWPLADMLSHFCDVCF
jgi:hypothetical protein